jgi:hypothetical protein
MTVGYDPDDEGSAHDELDELVDTFRKRFEEIMGSGDEFVVCISSLSKSC